MRINCRPEVAFLTLERSAQQSDSGPSGGQYA
jgi:hypothetical protein